MQAPTEIQNQLSTIGKTIVIKGEISASDPLYIYGAVEGSIKAPAHRVTVGKEGIVKADINAREVVVMGDVHGNVEGTYRVEVRTDGSISGDLTAHRVCVEEGAVLKGKIDIRKAAETAKVQAPQDSDSVLEETEEELTLAAS